MHLKPCLLFCERLDCGLDMLKSLMSLGLGSTVSFKKYALKAQIQVISLPLVTQNGIAKIVGALNS